MQLTVISPEEAAVIAPELSTSRNPALWVYHCRDVERDWTLSAATHAEPGSDKLSLGGFRIAPPERLESDGFSTDHEAIALAIGMEEKVHWSRVLDIAGPLGHTHLRQMVGGKVVIAPSPDAQMGEPRDAELLDFALECFAAIEEKGGFRLTTGQDLGHGVMRDGVTSSMSYLNQHFKGSVAADTSIPTGEGNFRLLTGMLRAFDIKIGEAAVGLIGCGNVGMRVLERLRDRGSTVIALEGWAERRAELEAMGVKVYDPEDKAKFIARPVAAFVVNSTGGSLDASTINRLSANASLKVVCGSENLVTPDPLQARVLRDSGKIYAPTELGGMMGYLTAAEEYLARLKGTEFDIETMISAAGKLESAGFRATTRILESGGRQSFEDAVTDLSMERQQAEAAKEAVRQVEAAATAGLEAED